MGIGILIGFIILLVIGFGAIALLIYSRKRESKVGKWISIIILFLLCLVLLTNKIDQLTISKKDIQADLKILRIELKDDFKIMSNKVTGMPDRIQKTKILISSEDKTRILNQITNSENFTEFVNNEELTNSNKTDQFRLSGEIFNFKYPKFYSREMFTRIENYPTRLFLYVDNKTSLIELQIIEQ